MDDGPPSKRLRPADGGVGPASDTGPDSDEESRRSSDASDTESSAESGSEAGSDASDEEEEEEEYCSDSEDEEDEVEARRKAARPLAKSGWRSRPDSANWKRDRTDCMDANDVVAASHRRWFPHELTFTSGFRVDGDLPVGGIKPGTWIYAYPDVVHGVLSGLHNFSSLSNPTSVPQLEECLVFSKPAKASRMVQSMRLLEHVGPGRANLLVHAPSTILEEVEHRRRHFSAEVHVSEVKCSRMESGNGPMHSDGAGAADLTNCKMVTKLRRGGTLFTQGVDGKWRFVQITAEGYVLLSTTAGARLHGAAHLKLVKKEDDGRHVFRAATEDKEVVSTILNLGAPLRGAHQESFIDAAQRFARGEACPPPQLCEDRLAEKAAAWEGRVKAQREAAVVAAAAAAVEAKEKEERAVERASKKVPL